MKIIEIILFALILASILTLITKLYIDSNNKFSISFKESMDLTKLPIITFENNGLKFNFLLDTGADFSVINESCLSTINHIKTSETGKVHGFEGNYVDTTYVNIPLEYNDNLFTDFFQVVDLSKAFGNVKAEYGVTLHGILGNSFFQKYKYILDFNKLKAYIK
jgi:hypothetical protein